MYDECFTDDRVRSEVIDRIDQSLGGNYIVEESVMRQTELDRVTTLVLSSGTSSGNLTGVNLLRNLQTIQINDDWSLEDLSPLSGLTNLTTLDLSGDSSIDDLTALSTVTSLQTLNLNGDSGIGDGANKLTPLSPLVNLTTLKVVQADISDVTPLRTLTSLQTLDLGANQIVDVSDLNSLTSLTTLYLDQNSVTDISGLTNLANLAKFDVSYNQLTDIGVVTNHMPSMVNFAAESNALTVIPSTIGNLTRLALLDLEDNKIDDAGFAPISGVSSTLTNLDMNKNKLTVLTPLDSHASITTLKVGFNLLGDTGLTNIATHHANLVVLDASGFVPDSTRDGGITVSLLDPVTGLTTLALNKDKIDNAQMKYVMDHHLTVTDLSLHSNNIDDLSSIASSPHATTMTSLNLATNHISDLTPLSGWTAFPNTDTNDALYVGNQSITEPTISYRTNVKINHFYKMLNGSYPASNTIYPSYDVSPSSNWSYDPSTGVSTWSSVAGNVNKVSVQFMTALPGHIGMYGGKATREITPLVTRSVTFEPGTGASWTSISGTNPLAVNDGDTITTEPTVTGMVAPTGMRQDGWIYASTSNGASLGAFVFGSSGSGTAVTGDIYVRPNWVRDSFAVHYDWNGGTWTGAAPSGSSLYQDSLTQPAAADLHAPAGKHFDHWEVAASASGPWTPFTFTGSSMPGHEIWIRPVWADDVVPGVPGGTPPAPGQAPGSPQAPQGQPQYQWCGNG